MQGPSWKHRRRLIYLSYALSALMIIAGGAMFFVDQFGVGVTLITVGGSILTIILTAYTGFAAYEDVKIWNNDGEDNER
jgi:hypothetical protein